MLKKFRPFPFAACGLCCLPLLFGARLARADIALPGRLVIEDSDSGGLAPQEENLSREIARGLARRLHARGVTWNDQGPVHWVVSSDISRLVDRGHYVWNVSLSRQENDDRDVFRQWVGTAMFRNGLTFHRGPSIIDDEGLLGEITLRIAHALKAYDPRPGVRYLRDMQALTSESDAATAAAMPQVSVHKGCAGGAPALRVRGTASGKVWYLTATGDQVRLLPTSGANLVPGHSQQVICPPGAQELYILFRANRPGRRVRHDPRLPVADVLVGVSEMRSGYGEIDPPVLRLLDEMYRDASSLWLMRRVPLNGTAPPADAGGFTFSP